MPTLLLWVMEDQSRGVPHLHFVLGHTTALEKAFARAFFRELKSAAYAHGLGHTTTYEKAVLEQGKYEAGRLRNYVSKLAGYLSKGDGAAAFLLRHSKERIYDVAPWLSRLSGVTMTIARLARRVWAARKGLIDMPSMTAEQEELVSLLLDPVVCAPNAPQRPHARGSPGGRPGLRATRERSDRGGRVVRRAGGRARSAQGRGRWLRQVRHGTNRKKSRHARKSCRSQPPQS